MDIRIHASNSQSHVAYDAVAETLRSLPDIRTTGAYFSFQNEALGTFIDVIPGAAESGSGTGWKSGPDASGGCNQIRIPVPGDLDPQMREPLAEFSFSLGHKFGWQVYLDGNAAPITDSAALFRSLGGGATPTSRATAGCLSVLPLALLCFGIAYLCWH